MNCFECGDADHLVKDCPQKKNNNSSKWNKDRKKKAMVASWSDSDSSSESDSEEEQANLCLMAGQDDHIEVTVRNIMSSPSEVISDVLKEMFRNEESYLAEIKRLKNQVLEQTKEKIELSFKNKELEISQTKSDRDVKALTTDFKALNSQVKKVVFENDLITDQYTALKCEFDVLLEQKNKISEELVICKKNWAKYANSEKTFNLILESHSANRHGIGFNLTVSKSTSTKFVKAKNKPVPTCFHYNRTGHVKWTYPFRRTEPHILRNSFPYRLKGQIRQIWVKKGVRPPNMVDSEYESKFSTWSESWIRH